MEQPDESAVQSWLARSKPSGFAAGADVVFVLDGGNELKAHSVMLAAHSQVMCDMFLQWWTARLLNVMAKTGS